MVISLAGWLYEIFGLKAFVDSVVWGYCDNLLKIIDKDYCIKEQWEDSTIYSYQKRNYSTSHVNMMLCMALAKMIDNVECLFFINTPESILVSDTITQNSTLSPWIYAELQISSIVRHKKLEEYRKKISYSDKSVFSQNDKLQIKYDVQLEHLINLDNNDMMHWWKTAGDIGEYPLDGLYNYKKLI